MNEAGTLVISPKYDTTIDTANKNKMLSVLFANNRQRY